MTPQSVFVSAAPLVVFDGSQGSAFELTLTRDVYGVRGVNLTIGKLYVVMVKQDQVGGHAFGSAGTLQAFPPMPQLPGRAVARMFLGWLAGTLIEVAGPYRSDDDLIARELEYTVNTIFSSTKP